MSYVHYDLDRILVTTRVGIDPETEAPILVVEESGGHAVEGLILARYMMRLKLPRHSSINLRNTEPAWIWQKTRGTN